MFHCTIWNPPVMTDIRNAVRSILDDGGRRSPQHAIVMAELAFSRAKVWARASAEHLHDRDLTAAYQLAGFDWARLANACETSADAVGTLFAAAL